MNYKHIDAPPPKELISDSLHDAFEPEQQRVNLIDQLMMVSLVVNKDYFISGSLLGLDMSENPRIDVKALITKSFDFIKNIVLNQERIHSLVLTLGDDFTQVTGPFKISSIKILETDYENRTCVLAIDLLKVQP